MRALTLTQPWATLVAIGAKTVETRCWYTAHRGLIAIHAAKGFPDDARYIVTEAPFTIALDDAWASTLPTASIIAVVDLTACWQFKPDTVAQIRGRSACGDLPPFEADFGNYEAGRYGFKLHNVIKLPTPVPARGMLNLWNVPADVEAAVREQLAVSA